MWELRSALSLLCPWAGDCGPRQGQVQWSPELHGEGEVGLGPASLNSSFKEVGYKGEQSKGAEAQRDKVPQRVFKWTILQHLGLQWEPLGTERNLVMGQECRVAETAPWVASGGLRSSPLPS